MSSVSRKDFLRLSTLGIISSLLPIKEVEALSSILKSPSKSSVGDFQLAIETARAAKEFFYKKKYDEAEARYKECILLAPAYIQFYDNLDNVYGAKGEFLKSVELYKVGLERNPQKIAFYDRTARALMRLELGYKALADKYKSQISSASLLNDALTLYNSAISIYPAQYLLVAKQKLENKIAIDATKINFRTDIQHELGRKTRSNLVKLQKQSLTIASIEDLLDKINNRKRTPLYFQYQIETRAKHIVKEKRSLIYLMLLKYLNANDRENSINTAIRLFEVDHSDCRSIMFLKKVFYQYDMFYDYISYQRTYALRKKDVFSNLGLIDAIETAFKRKVATSVDLKEAEEKAEEMLLHWQLPPNSVVDIVNKLVKVFILQNNAATARLYAERTINIIDLKSSMHINKLIHSYANALFINYNFIECEKVLLLSIYNIKEDENDPVLNKIQTLLSNAEKENLTSRLSLYYLLYTLYAHINQPDKAIEVLHQIQVLNPWDAFVSKRM